MHFSLRTVLIIVAASAIIAALSLPIVRFRQAPTLVMLERSSSGLPQRWGVLYDDKLPRLAYLSRASVAASVIEVTGGKATGFRLSVQGALKIPPSQGLLIVFEDDAGDISHRHVTEAFLQELVDDAGHIAKPLITLQSLQRPNAADVGSDELGQK